MAAISQCKDKRRHIRNRTHLAEVLRRTLPIGIIVALLLTQHWESAKFAQSTTHPAPLSTTHQPAASSQWPSFAI
ncbi:hypothetical protein AWZ03_002164 [Drosophila navojoa]|uniref:Uncharacterized protein n=1 Tax=Drosophila navojoa TaxID=7232 RepID=A0A484BRE1_DRONA|nr:hypothetical protein AWZ03_002164 [Drosophila navojoa]